MITEGTVTAAKQFPKVAKVIDAIESVTDLRKLLGKNKPGLPDADINKKVDTKDMLDKGTDKAEVPVVPIDKKPEVHLSKYPELRKNLNEIDYNGKERLGKSVGDTKKEFEEHLRALSNDDLKKLDADPDLLDKEYDNFIEEKRKKKKPDTDSKLKIEEYEAPSTGKKIKVAVNDKAAVPINKIDIYAQGKVKSVSKEFTDLKALKQNNRKLFDADPQNAKRLKKLKDMDHNYDRSISMKKNLDSIGLNDTPSNNEKITKHLLDVGKNIDKNNNLWYKSILEGPKGKLKVKSTWKILEDGRAYLTTLNFIPI